MGLITRSHNHRSSPGIRGTPAVPVVGRRVHAYILKHHSPGASPSRRDSLDANTSDRPISQPRITRFTSRNRFACSPPHSNKIRSCLPRGSVSLAGNQRLFHNLIAPHQIISIYTVEFRILRKLAKFHGFYQLTI